jgi:hypothetical protein
VQHAADRPGGDGPVHEHDGVGVDEERVPTWLLGRPDEADEGLVVDIVLAPAADVGA